MKIPMEEVISCVLMKNFPINIFYTLGAQNALFGNGLEMDIVMMEQTLWNATMMVETAVGQTLARISVLNATVLNQEEVVVMKQQCLSQ